MAFAQQRLGAIGVHQTRHALGGQGVADLALGLALLVRLAWRVQKALTCHAVATAAAIHVRLARRFACIGPIGVQVTVLRLTIDGWCGVASHRRRAVRLGICRLMGVFWGKCQVGGHIGACIARANRGYARRRRLARCKHRAQSGRDSSALLKYAINPNNWGRRIGKWTPAWHPLSCSVFGVGWHWLNLSGTGARAVSHKVSCHKGNGKFGCSVTAPRAGSIDSSRLHFCGGAPSRGLGRLSQSPDCGDP